MRTSPNKHPLRVLVAIVSTGYTGWQKRAGVFRYIGEGRPWDVRLASTEDEIKSLRKSGERFDGIIFSAADHRLLSELPLGAKQPMVFFDINLPPDSSLLQRPTGTIFIHHDSLAIGEAAANHLLSCGKLRSFAYLDMSKRTSWSDQRQNSFKKTLADAGFALSVFSSNDRPEALADALAVLPHPTGLLVATDRLALPAYSICKEANLRIPDDVAILGVDDDATICESLKPSLSSVRTNPESIGYTAARLLDETMASPNRKSRHVTLKSQPTVTRRDSTSAESPYGRLVERGNAYIAAHATEGIGPNDVARHLGVSRRILDLRFHEISNTTVLQTIQTNRLQAVKHLLTETKETIEAITDKCGYGSANHLKKIFKENFGCSMREWRQTGSFQTPGTPFERSGLASGSTA